MLIAFRPFITTLLSVVMISCLAGCMRDLDVTVTSERGLVVFSIPETDPPCVDRVTVYAASDQMNPVWLIDASGQKRCLTRFYYGKTPTGFSQRGPVEALARGTVYRVVVQRPGATGIAYFSPGRDGPVETGPTG